MSTFSKNNYTIYWKLSKKSTVSQKKFDKEFTLPHEEIQRLLLFCRFSYKPNILLATKRCDDQVIDFKCKTTDKTKGCERFYFIRDQYVTTLDCPITDSVMNTCKTLETPYTIVVKAALLLIKKANASLCFLTVLDDYEDYEFADAQQLIDTVLSPSMLNAPNPPTTTPPKKTIYNSSSTQQVAVGTKRPHSVVIDLTNDEDDMEIPLDGPSNKKRKTHDSNKTMSSALEKHSSSPPIQIQSASSIYNKNKESFPIKKYQSLPYKQEQPQQGEQKKSVSYLVKEGVSEASNQPIVPTYIRAFELLDKKPNHLQTLKKQQNPFPGTGIKLGH